VTYLRISLTEHCNFRCVYCLPTEGLSVLPDRESLTRAEIARLVVLAGRVGVSKIRLTGGEPLLRRDLLEIIADLRKIETVEDLSITTNGSLLAPLVPRLQAAGLDRLNISLDSLDPERFAEVTLSHVYHRVLEATHLALNAGFPVKLNCLLLKGLSEDEVLQFAALARRYPLDVRFLEFMPLCGANWNTANFVPINWARTLIAGHFDLAAEEERQDRPAQTFRLKDGRGKIGFIGSISEPFCNACSRIRLTADGKIRPCLFSNAEVSLKDLLRCDAGDEEILSQLRLAVALKPKGNQFVDEPYDGTTPAPRLQTSAPLIHNLGG
jgi:cyclic pyranopterin phosphate synthase